LGAAISRHFTLVVRSAEPGPRAARQQWELVLA